LESSRLMRQCHIIVVPPSNGGDKNKIEKGELQLVLDLHRSQPRG
jgi:hypothetical protein